MFLRPVDLVLRAVLEIAGVIGLILGGWSLAGVPIGLLLAIALPIGAAALWGTFRVPGDPGPAPVPVAGPLRLVIELGLLGAGALGWIVAGWPIVGIVLIVLIVLHYAMTNVRVRWLLGQR
jgi:hypothetical protein